MTDFTQYKNLKSYQTLLPASFQTMIAGFKVQIIKEVENFVSQSVRGLCFYEFNKKIDQDRQDGDLEQLFGSGKDYTNRVQFLRKNFEEKVLKTLKNQFLNFVTILINSEDGDEVEQLAELSKNYFYNVKDLERVCQVSEERDWSLIDVEKEEEKNFENEGYSIRDGGGKEMSETENFGKNPIQIQLNLLKKIFFFKTIKKNFCCSNLFFFIF